MVARSTLGMAYFFQGRKHDAIRELQQAVELSNRDPWPVGFLGSVYAATGDTASARKIIRELEERAEREYVPSNYVAAIYALLGDTDDAIRCLEKAYDERAPLVVFGTNTYPSWAFDSLRAHTRIRQLVAQLGIVR